jgi:hypothetical protein
MRALLVACFLLGVASVSSLARADDASASIERAKRCDAMTKGKRLSDAQYRAYMSSCLASEGAPRDPGETARTIEKRCNTVANERQLTGQDRISFMQTCRTKS